MIAIREKGLKLIEAVDEVLHENYAILGATPEERELTRAAIRDLTPEQLREAITQYQEART